MPTKIVNIKHGVPFDIYIGRPGKGRPGPLGSPIVPGELCPECGRVHRSKGTTLLCYERNLRRRVADDAQYRELVRSCDRKTLACFCVDRQGRGHCHGRVIARVAAELNR